MGLEDKTSLFIFNFEMKNRLHIIIIVFSIAMIATCVILHYGVQKAAKEDIYYIKCSSPKKCSIITGTSRAAEGIVPSVFNAKKTRFDSLYNFAFNLGVSPYGPTYFKAIRDKVDTSSTNNSHRLFIITIDPWAVSGKKNVADEAKNFKEKNSFLGTMTSFSSAPNLSYFYATHKRPLYHFLFNGDNGGKIDLNGGQRISHTETLSEKFIMSHTRAKMSHYRKKVAQTNQVSPLRITYFTKIIKWLQKYGSVHVVRLPVSAQMAKLEHEYAPGFSDQIMHICAMQKIPFHDFLSMSSDSLCYDGNHLQHKAASDFTQQLIEHILRDDSE